MPIVGWVKMEIHACGTTGFWGSEDGREYGGENGSGGTMKDYQSGGTSYLSSWCRANPSILCGARARTLLNGFGKYLCLASCQDALRKEATQQSHGADRTFGTVDHTRR